MNFFQLFWLKGEMCKLFANAKFYGITQEKKIAEKYVFVELWTGMLAILFYIFCFCSDWHFYR